MYQTSLFENIEPLASRMRPKDLSEFVGQKHLIGEDKLLKKMIEKDNLSSMIFWGPPGTGKTTLARIIAHETKSNFITFSAVTSGIKEIKKVMEEAENNKRLGVKTILFIDEIHRFNKAQQDAFLPYVEKGSIILIGATTENPSFEINNALLSRCRVFVLKELSAHFLWIGERTRDWDGAHVDLLSRVRNPIGVKLGPTTSVDDAVRLMDKLNPEGEEGRITFITRMGATKIRDILPALVEGVTRDGRPVTWMTDPMHGNTITASNGYKTRRMEDVVDEVQGFFEVHTSLGTVPGGVHIELTGDSVTEVLGGSEELSEEILSQRYETLVDPRLNHGQSLELAFLVSQMLRENS